MFTRRLVIVALFAHCLTLVAEERAPVEPTSLPAPDQELAPVKPPIAKIDENRYRVGELVIDKRTREIRVPCQVNMQEGLLEFLLVHENGKIHESLFSTKASPTSINLAFTLLGYKPSRELYPIQDEDYAVTGEFPKVPDDVKASARIDIDVEWKHDGKTKRQSVNRWIQHTGTERAMPPGPWVYGGSEFYQGRYSPEMSGDIAAIFLSISSIINYPGKDHQDDTVWICHPDRVPTIGTSATVVFKPHQTSNKK